MAINFRSFEPFNPLRRLFCSAGACARFRSGCERREPSRNAAVLRLFKWSYYHQRCHHTKTPFRREINGNPIKIRIEVIVLVLLYEQ